MTDLFRDEPDTIVEQATQDALRSAGERIKWIDDTTRAGVRDRVREAIDQGMSPREASEHVRSWSGWDEYRAERIARTETMFAYNTAAISTYGQMGVTHVVADDGDKDAECAQRHGGTFTVSEAADIFDHPNGTLDWLPVAPGIDPEQVRQELSSVREVAQQPYIETPAPPRVPTVSPPKPPIELRSGADLAKIERDRVARAAAEAAEQRLAQERLRTARYDKIRDSSRDDVLRMFDAGEADFEDVLRYRFNVGGSRSEGLSNVIREAGHPFDKRHERELIKVLDDAKAQGATWRLDIIRFSNRTKVNRSGGGVAADMGTYQHSEGVRDLVTGIPRASGELLTTTDAQAITIYRNSARYINSATGYAEYGATHVTDFYKLSTHELGHAIEKGVAAVERGVYKRMDAIHGAGDATTRAAYEARITKELRQTRRYLREQEGFMRGMGDPTDGWTERMHQIQESRRQVIAAFQRQEAELLRLRAEAKSLSKKAIHEMHPTRYSSGSPREDWAESVTLYRLNPEKLRKWNPERYRLVDETFKAGQQKRATGQVMQPTRPGIGNQEIADAVTPDIPTSFAEWQAHPEHAAQIRMHQTLFQGANYGSSATVGRKFENSATAINRYLRSGGKRPARWTQAELDELEAFSRSQVVVQETYVYRGVQGSRGVPKVGDEWVEPGYTSATVQAREAATFARPGGQGRALTQGGEGFLYRIRLDAGQRYGGRLHPILPKDTRFRVIGKTKQKGHTVVDLEVV